MEMKKTKVRMNKPAYLGMWILDFGMIMLNQSGKTKQNYAI